MKLREAIDLFADASGITEKRNTAKGYVRDLRQFCVYLRNPFIETIAPGNCEQYVKDLLEAGYQTNSVMLKGVALRRLFRFLKKRGYGIMDPSDVSIPRREFKMPQIAEDWQIERILAFLPESSSDMRTIRNRAIFLFLRDTGIRLGEMLTLNLDDIDLETRKAVIQTEKSRGTRPVRVSFWFDDCQKAILNWLNVRMRLEKRVVFDEPEALFIGLYGSRAGKRLRHSGVEIALRKLSRKADVPTVNPHSLRHRKGRLLRENGASNSTISGVLGHASLASSYIYTMMDDEALESAARQYGDESGALRKSKEKKGSLHNEYSDFRTQKMQNNKGSDSSFRGLEG